VIASMPVHTVYLPGVDFSAVSRTTFEGEEAHHAVRVLRAFAGDGVRLANGAGQIARGTISKTLKLGREEGWQVEVTIDALERIEPNAPDIHAYVSPPKGDRLAAMVEALSQVGANAFTPLITRHTTVDPREGKVDRMRRVATESMKQCMRAWEMQVHAPLSLQEAMHECDSVARVKVVADVGQPTNTKLTSKRIGFFVGPEGGWHEDEVRLLAGANAQLVGLGPHIMRIETAAPVGVAMLLLCGV